MEDVELVKSFLEQDGRSLKAYNSIVKKYENLVFSVCFKYLRNKELSEDVSQDVFLKVYGNLSKLQNPKQLKSWMMRIAVNSCADQYKKRKKAQTISEKISLELKIEKEEVSNEDPRMDLLREAIELLNENDKDLIMLHYFSDMRASEIAEEFQINESTIKMRLKRTRDKVMKIIHEKGDGL